MTYPLCPYCSLHDLPRSKVRRHGVYFRTSDGKKLVRYRCLGCKRSFSHSTFSFCWRQKKRHANQLVSELLDSLVSQRRAAKILRLNRKTVARKFWLMSLRSEQGYRAQNFAAPKASAIEFDDLETFEHTKCKPLSVTLAVESKTRRILGVEVSQMPAKGNLREKSLKYGIREDLRREGRRRLFARIKPFVAEDALILSDKNPHYRKDVREFFPNAKHITFKGRRAKLNGQGELKKGGYDPLYSLNHTCAMLRANVNRLIRKTWCTTKSPNRLYAHLVLYAHYHNQNLRLD